MRKRYKYINKWYSATELAKKSGVSLSCFLNRIRRGWSIKETVEGRGETVTKVKRVQSFYKTTRYFKTNKINIDIMKCKCCGLEIPLRKGSKKRFCDSKCRYAYLKNPEEYGQWWKE